MPFDLGFSFRSTSGFVTDSSFCVPVLNETYPHLYTAGNGYSVNAGIVSGPSVYKGDRDNTLDARIAGVNFVDPTTTEWIFRVNLSSGSAPGAGTYTIDIAMGDPAAGRTYQVELRDNATVRQTISGTTTGGSPFLDATSTLRAATSSWTGTPVTGIVFGSTTVNLVMNPAGGVNAYHTLAHLRLTLAAAAAASLLPPANPMQHMLVR